MLMHLGSATPLLGIFPNGVYWLCACIKEDLHCLSALFIIKRENNSKCSNDGSNFGLCVHVYEIKY